MAQTPVAGKTAGEWEDITGATNVVVGVKGSSYMIQVHLGTEAVAYNTLKPVNGTTQIAKAAAFRVVNNGNSILNYEFVV